jgi:hypothetical protein
VSDKQALIEQEFARVRSNLVSLKRNVESVGPPCTRCSFATKELRDGSPYFNNICEHPVYLETRFDPVTGGTAQFSMAHCSAARKAGELCGPEASLFLKWEPSVRTRRERWRLFWERHDPFAWCLFGGVALALTAALLVRLVF